MVVIFKDFKKGWSGRGGLKYGSPDELNIPNWPLYWFKQKIDRVTPI